MPRKKKHPKPLDLFTNNPVGMGYIHASYLLMLTLIKSQESPTKYTVARDKQINAIAHSLMVQGIAMTPALANMDEGDVLTMYAAAIEGRVKCSGDCSKCSMGHPSQEGGDEKTCNKAAN
jgi:hypothetical protein